MITILHGEDFVASYTRLQEMLENYRNFEKVRVAPENSDQLYQALFAQDLLGIPKVIIVEDLLSSKKIGNNELKNIPQQEPVFFWEKKMLSPSILKIIPSGSIIQVFKPSPTLFRFLDSIGSSQKNTLELLEQISQIRGGLTWHIESRLFSLILVKLGSSSNQVSNISGKPMQTWQWEKLNNQAKYFSLAALKRLFNAILRLETMIKTGATNMDEKSLVSLTLFKHSQS